MTLAADAHGTWDDGHLSASQIIAHHNSIMDGCFARVVPADGISMREMVGA